MSKVENFLSAEDEQEIIKAIVTSEKNTSGEIRIHIEPTTKLEHYDRAKEVFHYLKMDNTKQENGVLFYIAVRDKKFAIYGDKGINSIVADDFWDTTRDAIEVQFKKGNFKQGIVEGILKAGKVLEMHFPWNHNDTNELSDEISKG
ncbi:MAG: TPM domain-containing protein [Cellulophaga sp.]